VTFGENKDHMTSVAKISLRKIKAFSLFKLMFIASGAVCIPFWTCYGFFSLLGNTKTFVFEETPIVGTSGLAIGILLGIGSAILVAILAWLGACVGIVVFGFFRPISLEYVREEGPNKTTTANDLHAD